jgi:hypothetical protein
MNITPEDIQELREYVGNQGYRMQHLNRYKRLYSVFLNKIFEGCACKASRMHTELKQYMVKNNIK